MKEKWFYIPDAYMGHGNPSGFAIKTVDKEMSSKYNMKWEVTVCTVDSEDIAKLIVDSVNRRFLND